MRTPLLSFLIVCLSVLPLFAGNGNGDAKTLGATDYSPAPTYKGFSYYSQYVPMSDSVRLAVDVFLPKKLEEGKKVPTIVYFVRYVRTFQLKAFWRGLKDPAFGSVAEEEVKFFTSHGYAVAIVDLRGTGASFGHRDMEFSPKEVQDMGEMLDWIVKEPWSDGKTATTGISYTGTTAELALITKHPSLKACVPRSNIWDLYTDIVYPGGIRQTPFVKVWRTTTQALDRNEMEPFGSISGFIKGPSPVDGDKKGVLLQEAMAEHKANFDIFEGLYRINSRNEPDKGYGAELSADDCSIHTRMEDVQASGVPIFRISGWFDGALSNSVFKGLWNTTNTKRVMVGPWDHGPGEHFTNFSGNRKDKDVDVEREVLRFLDFYVKGIDNGLGTEPPVNFYQMGHEKWVSTDTWPPKEMQSKDFQFGKNTLTTSSTGKLDTVAYACNYATTTGRGTRWNSLTVLYRTGPTFYGPRNAQDSMMAVFDSPVLTEDAEITGHPEVTVNVSSNTGHGHLFVYLEEVLPDGTSRYITEGQLDITHLKVCVKGDYECRFPQQSFKLEDRLQLQPGEFHQALVNMIPTSYLVKKGNRIRIAIGVADVDHFDLPAENTRPTEMKIIVGGENGSFAKLPIKQEPALN
jgi:putative CocE/NonD family hydrolase